MGIMNFCKISFDFRVGSGRFRFGSFLNDRLKWSVRVVSAMPKVGASLVVLCLASFDFMSKQWTKSMVTNNNQSLVKTRIFFPQK